MADDRTIRSEDARSRQYRKQLERKRASVEAVGRQVTHSRSADWTGKGLPSRPDLPDGALIGRVAIDRNDELLSERDFYIGVYPIEHDGISVFSWAAPVAETFFRPGGPAAREHHEWFDRVVARRTFSYAGDRVADVEDEILSSAIANRDEVFPLNDTLRIESPKQQTSKSPLSRFRSSANQPTRHDEPPAARSALPHAPSPRITNAKQRQAAGPKLRAGRILRKALDAPRSSALNSVLHTMQPDQYRAITETADRTWIFRGGPGTGKTVVAAHRACYLSNDARDGARARKVLILGPTDGYVHHVGSIVRQLDLSGSVTVRSLPEILTTLSRLQRPPTGSETGPYDEVDPERFEDCLTVAYDLRQTHKQLSAEIVYDALRLHLVSPRRTPVTRVTLPPWDKARTWSRYLPIVASCAMAARYPLEEWDHIIVDEAQDVRPLEWVLVSHLCGAQAHFTLLGDMNQRRHLTTYRTWPQLVGGLRQYNEGLKASCRELQMGYRSTQQILDYASHLVPKGDRPSHNPLRTDGTPVVVEHCKNAASKMWLEASSHAAELANKYADGTVAIISPDVQSAVAEIRRQGATSHDWARFQWKLGEGAPIAILEPNKARGLEFDAVVVVEPVDFPQDEFGSGSLFTSMTRANQELRIVHSKPLPEKLRKKRLARTQRPREIDRAREEPPWAGQTAGPSCTALRARTSRFVLPSLRQDSVFPLGSGGATRIFSSSDGDANARDASQPGPPSRRTRPS